MPVSNSLNPIGYKFIARDQGTASNVHLELWLDVISNGVLANQNWEKIVDFVDADNKRWTTQASAWCCATHANNSYRGVNQTSSKFVYLRTDGVNLQYYKWISVREINPEYALHPDFTHECRALIVGQRLTVLEIRLGLGVRGSGRPRRTTAPAYPPTPYR